MYNRYLQNYGEHRKGPQPLPIAQPVNPQIHTGIPAAVNIPPPVREAAPPSKAQEGSLLSMLKLPSLSGIKSAFQGLLGDKLDISDLLLILILLLLYLEKEDEEILITLSALVFTGFK